MTTVVRDREGIRDLILRSVRRTRDGCWIWLGPSVPGPTGRRYGYLEVDRRRVNVGRISYEAFKTGPPLENYSVDHTCNEPLCVNPDHLVKSHRLKSGGPGGGPRKGKSSGSLYPWDEWFAVPEIFLRRGEHYSCGSGAFAQQIRNNASQRGVKVSLKETSEGFNLVTTRRDD